MNLSLIASQLHQMRVELQQDNDAADEIEAEELRREDRELMERQRWGGIQRNNPNNPNL